MAKKQPATYSWNWREQGRCPLRDFSPYWSLHPVEPQKYRTHVALSGAVSYEIIFRCWWRHALQFQFVYVLCIINDCLMSTLIKTSFMFTLSCAGQVWSCRVVSPLWTNRYQLKNRWKFGKGQEAYSENRNSHLLFISGFCKMLLMNINLSSNC